MKKVSSVFIIATLFLASGFKPGNEKTYYAYAFVYSNDWKTIYVSSVFSFTEETPCSKIKDWADEEFTDNIEGFSGGKGLEIRPYCTYVHPDRENTSDEVRKQGNDLIDDERNGSKHTVKLVKFPPSK